MIKGYIKKTMDNSEMIRCRLQLKTAGVNESNLIVDDDFSALYDNLQQGDVIIIRRFADITDNTSELKRTINLLKSKGVHIISLNDRLSYSNIYAQI